MRIVDRFRPSSSLAFGLLGTALIACSSSGDGGGSADSSASGTGDTNVTIDDTPPPPPPDSAPGTSSAAELAKRLRGKSNFLIGLGNDLADDHTKDGAYTLGQTLDIHYTYLNGVVGDGGWPDWNPGGSFVNAVGDPAVAKGVTPMFTLYNAYQWESDNKILSNATYMKKYWDSVKLMYQRIALLVKPTIVHLEPDFWADIERATGGDPSKMKVTIASLAPDCAGVAEDVSGMGKCLIMLARKYAPNAVVGLHVSEWGADTVAEVITFSKAIGATDGDLLVVETLDRDAGCFEAGTDPNCKRDGKFYWDESNAASPNFHEHFAWAKAIHDGLGKPLLWWQVPLGVPSDTPGGTSGHYRDNRVHYFFRHIDELIAAGGVGVVFGTGADHQTYIESDGSQFKTAVTAYFSKPWPL